MGSSVTTRRKNWERITILGTFGVISEIQRPKFGVSVTYIFGGKIWGSDMTFRGKILLGRRHANLCFHFAGSGENLPDIAKSRDATLDNKLLSP